MLRNHTCGTSQRPVWSLCNVWEQHSLLNRRVRALGLQVNAMRVPVIADLTRRFRFKNTMRKNIREFTPNNLPLFVIRVIRRLFCSDLGLALLSCHASTLEDIPSL